MKSLKYLFAGLALIILAACSGGSSYDASKCEALNKKCNNPSELTQADYNDMADQILAISENLQKEYEKMGKEKFKESAQDNETIKEQFGYFLRFGLSLSGHEKELSPDAAKKLLKAEEIIKNMDD